MFMSEIDSLNQRIEQLQQQIRVLEEEKRAAEMFLKDMDTAESSCEDEIDRRKLKHNKMESYSDKSTFTSVLAARIQDNYGASRWDVYNQEILDLKTKATNRINDLNTQISNCNNEITNCRNRIEQLLEEARKQMHENKNKR